MAQIPCRIRGRCTAFRESPRIVGLHEVVLMQADIAFLDIFEKRRMRDTELRRGRSCRDVSALILAVEAVESLGKGFQSPSSGILCIRDLVHMIGECLLAQAGDLGGLGLA